MVSRLDSKRHDVHLDRLFMEGRVRSRRQTDSGGGRSYSFPSAMAPDSMKASSRPSSRILTQSALFPERLRYRQSHHVRACRERQRRFRQGRIVASITAAAATVTDMRVDFRVSIHKRGRSKRLSSVSFTWLLVPSKIDDAGKKRR